MSLRMTAHDAQIVIQVIQHDHQDIRAVDPGLELETTTQERELGQPAQPSGNSAPLSFVSAPCVHRSKVSGKRSGQ